MPQMVFAPARVRLPLESLVGEESPGLRLFRRIVPPFIHLEVIQQGTPDYDDLRAHSVTFAAGKSFANNVIEFMSRLIDDRMGQGTKEFYTSTVTDFITRDAVGRRLGIPLLKAIIAEMTEVEESAYIEGVTKVYVIHPPQLEDELRRHLSALPVPATANSASERLITVAVSEKMRHFVVEPYKMDLTRRRSTDPRWLIVHMYNPATPALAMKVEAQGPLTFKEPTLLLSDTTVAESWAMGVMLDYLREGGVDVRCVSYEPNGPKTFPDYRARLNGTPWDFEITRVLGDILAKRLILDRPRDARRNIDKAIQSPPIDERDVVTALDRAIKSKESRRRSNGTARNLCLVLLNALDLHIHSQSAVWQGMDLSAFDAVVLVNGYSQPSVELIRGRFSRTSSCPRTIN